MKGVGIVQKSKQYQYDVIRNWLCSTSNNSLAELKQKCEYYREVSENSEYHPYKCVVWVYDKGPDGRRCSYETIAQELGITEKKAHESKWIGLLLLGYKAAEHPIRTRRKAQEIDQIWQEHLDAEKNDGQIKTEQLKESFVAPIKIKDLEDEILKTARERRKIIAQEIEQIKALKDLNEKELAEWDRIRAVYEQLFEIEKKEEKIIEKLRAKPKLRLNY